MEDRYSAVIEWLKKYTDASKVTKDAYDEGTIIFAKLSTNKSLLRFFSCRQILDRHKSMLHAQLTTILNNHINVINYVGEKKPEEKTIAKIVSPPTTPKQKKQPYKEPKAAKKKVPATKKKTEKPSKNLKKK